MKNTSFITLTEEEYFNTTGGWNWEYFTYAVAAVGVVGAVVCPPVAVVSGVYEVFYWGTRAIVS